MKLFRLVPWVALLLVIALFGLACGGGEPAPTAAPSAPADVSAAGASQEPSTLIEPVEGAVSNEAAHIAEEISLEASEAAGEDAHSAAEEEAGHQEPQDPNLSGATHDGRDLFTAVGCAACHGLDAEGTELAPALPGHTEAQVRRQARAPVGIMPVFPNDKISEAQLDTLVDYVTGLSGGHLHQKIVDVGAEMEMHHWMALSAIEVENIDEALHHVQHIIDLTQGDHRARMQLVITELNDGNLHDSEHQIKEMLAGVLADDISGDALHLRLALSPARVGDTDGAVHHVEHFIGVAAGASLEEGRAILALVQSGDLNAAAKHLEGFLGTNGVAMEGEDHNDAEAMTGHDEAEGMAGHDEAEEMTGHDEPEEMTGHDEAEEGHTEEMAGLP
jgi:mono/diheme cytochrome c family protein